jgi:hypothetical protein
MPRLSTLLVFLASVIGVATSSVPAEDTLRVATFQADVTPPLGSLLYTGPIETIEHPLLAKGIVIEAGGKRYVLCAVDWCVMLNTTHSMFRSKVAAAAQTDVLNVAVHCVHQHTAPPHDAGAQELLQKQKNPPPYRNLKDLEVVTDCLAAEVKKSLDRLQPFDTVGTGEAKVDRIAAIRRVFTDDGTLLTRWSACTDPELRAMPEGPIDPMLKTVTLAQGEKPIVRMHFYATHPQTYYRDGRTSYDFPGMARQRLQEEEGVFQIYFTGCAGDVTAGKYNDGTPHARAELADRLLAGMKASAESTRLVPVDKIAWRSVPLQLVPRTDGDRDPEKNRATLEDPQADPEARIQAAWVLSCIARLAEPMDVSCLQIGPARILYLPGEPMVAFQHFAQQVLPDTFVAVAGYGLASTGYICTEEAFKQGGYEPSASNVVPESEKALKEAIQEALETD